MKLSEKILYYRKAAGLSQEELAARIGVSRQAVSKWETGESTPEVGKLAALAREFGITVDQLLSPDDPRAEERVGKETSASPTERYEALPLVGRMVRRWGWLAGVYLALQGAGLALAGGIGRYLFGRMFYPVAGLEGDMEAVFSQIPGFAPFRTMGYLLTGMMALGLVILGAGILLAIVLYTRGRKKP